MKCQNKHIKIFLMYLFSEIISLNDCFAERESRLSADIIVPITYVRACIYNDSSLRVSAGMKPKIIVALKQIRKLYYSLIQLYFCASFSSFVYKW